MTAQELTKAKLATQLADTEGTPRAAVEELERMKTVREKMDEERAFMVAEVEKIPYFGTASTLAEIVDRVESLQKQRVQHEQWCRRGGKKSP